jgi:hypothetical protein
MQAIAHSREFDFIFRAWDASGEETFVQITHRPDLD